MINTPGRIDREWLKFREISERQTDRYEDGWGGHFLSRVSRNIDMPLK